MSNLNYIINQVTTKPKNGVAVLNNFTGNWDVPFATLSDIKARGFQDVSALFQDVISKAQNEITVYLKRSNGSSSIPMLNGSKQEIKVVLKPLDNTNKDVSKNVATASSGNSDDATTSYQQPITNTPTMHPSQQPPTPGLMGGLNQSQMQVYDVYAKADRYAETKESLTTALKSAQTTEEKYRVLERDHFERGYEIRDLKKEITTIKETHAKELSEASRPIVSADKLEMAQGFLPVIMGFAEKFAPVKAGLAGAEPQPQEQFSEIKTKLLNFVKNEGFDDGYCQLFFDIMNQSISSPDTVTELQKLIN